MVGSLLDCRPPRLSGSLSCSSCSPCWRCPLERGGLGCGLRRVGCSLARGCARGRFLWMITIALSDGSTVVVRSSIAPCKTSKEQVDEINRYLA